MPQPGNDEGQFGFSVVQGIFKQSDPEFRDSGYDSLRDSFGLIDKEGDKWGKFNR